jgi:FAD/FMN-containing dehydrogenase
MSHATVAGNPLVATHEAIDQFEASLRGDLITPSHPAYDEVRALYNGMIDKRPALIARCRDVADVIATVNFARAADLPLAIRGGGHHGAGLSSIDGGIMLDLSLMKGVRVDPIARTVRVEPGCTTAEVDHATHPFGLATPTGTVGSTGMAGLTLGGGVGHLTRKHGLTIDNLLAADVVLADGTLVTTTADEHPDLFWALRGGGGNFGVVTSFLFRLHHVDTVIGGPMLWPLDQAGDVMRWYRNFIATAPEDINGFFAFLTIPPVPLFPEALHLQKMCGVVWCSTASPEETGEILAPVRAQLPPLVDGVQPMPFPALQTAFDALIPSGLQWYWKADFVRDLSDEAIARHIEHAQGMPPFQSTMHMYPMNGAANRIGQAETAFSYRDVTWAMVIVGIDADPANAETITAWTQDYWQALHPYSAGGAYVNMMMEEGQERVQASYRDNYDRLTKVKRQYDPTNFFRINQNITPAP